MSTAAELDRARVFAANRAHGSVDLRVAAHAGVTRIARLHQEGSLRARFPNAIGDAEAVLINTAGGAAGGDRFDIRAAVGPGAALTVTTAAAEKVYRAIGTATEISVALNVEAGGRLSWLPQETILFDRADLSRSFEVTLAPDASLLLAEGIVFGRSARDERVEHGRLIDRWRIRRGDRLVFAETLRLDGAIAQKLAEPAVASGGVAVATIVLVPGEGRHAEAVRALADRFAGEVGVSCWNGICVVRFCAHDGAALRTDMIATLAALGAALPRLWLN